MTLAENERFKGITEQDGVFYIESEEVVLDEKEENNKSLSYEEMTTIAILSKEYTRESTNAKVKTINAYKKNPI